VRLDKLSLSHKNSKIEVEYYNAKLVDAYLHYYAKLEIFRIKDSTTKMELWQKMSCFLACMQVFCADAPRTVFDEVIELMNVSHFDVTHWSTHNSEFIKFYKLIQTAVLKHATFVAKMSFAELAQHDVCAAKMLIETDGFSDKQLEQLAVKQVPLPSRAELESMGVGSSHSNNNKQ
jgi:hypothetical protein